MVWEWQITAFLGRMSNDDNRAYAEQLVAWHTNNRYGVREPMPVPDPPTSGITPSVAARIRARVARLMGDAILSGHDVTGGA